MTRIRRPRPAYREHYPDSVDWITSAMASKARISITGSGEMESGGRFCATGIGFRLPNAANLPTFVIINNENVRFGWRLFGRVAHYPRDVGR
ncbi:MAG: hypothetical protein C7B46_12175 [Sulfobacillus benefaciens]|uniref:Uncharacterized protein n=1 Tax=Sulfobacillus benefaciens TaxID=453960 RepID=A0A2T2XER6_9FIRM|nr:MAG: hypothetical protein C7B46_12175 [Sulfobacillus benefaciens]